jgi:hypothetical protein
MDTKLTVRVSEDLLQGAKRYAEQNGTTLTRLISAYLRRLTQESSGLSNAPIVQRLSGSLSADVTEQDYWEYLDRKYGES